MILGRVFSTLHRVAFSTCLFIMFLHLQALHSGCMIVIVLFCSCTLFICKDNTDRGNGICVYMCVFACAAKVCEFGLQHTHRYSEYIVAMLSHATNSSLAIIEICSLFSLVGTSEDAFLQRRRRRVDCIVDWKCSTGSSSNSSTGSRLTKGTEFPCSITSKSKKQHLI